ncbi:hypothetical protein RND71_010667 [Anisodus tanguticus]|uniref:Late blight resistance protein homolog R1A-3 n=1 Tax=Anisodus tanguticus TaxID=243964 RepID=A0AAE1SKT1_9SOLA|nr:hypothetical protein RND71_010667 [Anisodus tanguticus]
MSFFSYDADPLRCLQWLEQNNGSLTQLGNQLKIELKWLKIFLHWSSKCVCSFEDLKHLLKSVEAEVQYARNELHSLCYRVSPPINETLGSVIFDIITRIAPFKLQVKEAFVSLSQCLLQPEDDLSLEFIDSVVEFLEDFLCYYDDKLIVPEVKEKMESLQYKLRFSRDFLRLTVKECTDLEKWKSLLMHIENLAAKTSGVSLLDEDLDKERSLSMKLELSDLSRDVIPMKQEFAGVYTVLLKGLMIQKPRTCSMDEFVVGFVDFLLKNIVELQQKCEAGGTVRNVLEKLHEELRLLVYFLTDPPKEYLEEEKVNEYLIQIEAAIHEVAFARETNEDIADDEMLVFLSDLLKKIEFIAREVKEVYQRVPRSSRYASPRTSGLGFIDFLLGNLNDLLIVKANLIAPVKNQIEAISRELEYMRSFLVHFANKKYEQSEKLKDLNDGVIDVTYKAEYVIDSLMVKGGPLWRNMLSDLEKDIKLVKLEIANMERFKKSTPVVTANSVQTDSVAMEEVVGFEDEASLIIGRLTRGPVQLDTVSIVGMPGLGKTTLAKKIYNDNYVANYFYIRAWCCISQQHNRRQLLLDILSQVTKISNRLTDTMSDGDLADKLRKCLMRKRYLIAIDDIWTIEAWDDLSGSFPDDDCGSRILLTSRLQDVASQVNHDGIHLLRFLSKEESWELLQLKTFPKESCPLELTEIGNIIAEKCEGLPLFVVLVAGLLSKRERSRECWENFEGDLSSEITHDPKKLMDIVDMSYQNLPHHLKPCFLYLGVFLEDKKIPASQLKWLWIAEGLVKKSLTESLEDVAEHYLMELVSRSLVLVSERRLTRGIKACRVHDLLRDFCLRKSKEENFLEWIYGSHGLQSYGEDYGADPHDPFSSEPKSYHQRRLCVYTKRNKFILSRPSGPSVRSLLFYATFDKDPQYAYDVSFISHNFRLLKVLDLRSINLGSSFQHILFSLVQLKYLAVQGAFDLIPASKGQFCNLETFLVKGLRGEIRIPVTLWNMTSLRHLHIDDRASFYWPNGDEEFFEEFTQMDNLLTFSTPVLDNAPSMENLLRRSANLRKLSCILREPWQFPSLDFLSQLESLKVFYYGGMFQSSSSFNFPKNLKKLTLSKFRRPWNEISTIGILPNLEVLKLLFRAYEGEEWEVRDDEFEKLKFLKMDSLNIARWSTSDDPFPHLERLLLQSCKNLEEIPSCFGDIPTLQMIEVKLCSNEATSSAWQIQEEQNDMGNEQLKVLITHPEWSSGAFTQEP